MSTKFTAIVCPVCMDENICVLCIRPTLQVQYLAQHHKKDPTKIRLIYHDRVGIPEAWSLWCPTCQWEGEEYNSQEELEEALVGVLLYGLDSPPDNCSSTKQQSATDAPFLLSSTDVNTYKSEDHDATTPN